MSCWDWNLPLKTPTYLSDYILNSLLQFDFRSLQFYFSVNTNSPVQFHLHLLVISGHLWSSESDRLWRSSYFTKQRSCDDMCPVWILCKHLCVEQLLAVQPHRPYWRLQWWQKVVSSDTVSYFRFSVLMNMLNSFSNILIIIFHSLSGFRQPKL